jgi:hypothetical protein
LTLSRAHRQARFLKIFRETANIKHSCKVAGISRQTFYEWRNNDEVFKAQLATAELEANDTLEYAGHDRAVNGVPSYVVSNGHLVYEEIPAFDEEGKPKLDRYGKQEYLRGRPIVERKYSDTLLITLLKARMPEKYKDKSQVEHSGAVGVDVAGFKELLMQRLERMEGSKE